MTESNITKQGDTEVTVEVTVPKEELEKQRSAALTYLGKNLSVKGFRPGHVPEKVVIEQVGENKLLEEMAHRAINKVLPDVVKEHELRIIGRPHVSVTKLAAGNPLEFKLIAAILPEIDLPDYKSIAAELNDKRPSSVAVTDEELENAIKDILKRVQAAEKQAKDHPKAPDASGARAGKTEGDIPIIGAGAPTDPAQLTDEFVKKLGPYENVADFKTKLREQMKTQKERAQHEKHRLSIIERVVEEAKPTVPEILIEAELDKMLGQIRADIERMGMKPDDYFKQVGKTEDDFRKEWRSDAEKRAKIQLILNTIAESESIRPDEQEVENQTKALLAQHPPQGGDMKQAEAATKVYVASMLTNERVFQFLEKQK